MRRRGEDGEKSVQLDFEVEADGRAGNGSGQARDDAGRLLPKETARAWLDPGEPRGARLGAGDDREGCAAFVPGGGLEPDSYHDDTNRSDALTITEKRLRAIARTSDPVRDLYRRGLIGVAAAASLGPAPKKSKGKGRGKGKPVDEPAIDPDLAARIVEATNAGLNAERALEVFNPPVDERKTREHAEDGAFVHSGDNRQNGEPSSDHGAVHRAKQSRAIAAAPPEVIELYRSDLIGKGAVFKFGDASKQAGQHYKSVRF